MDAKNARSSELLRGLVIDVRELEDEAYKDAATCCQTGSTEDFLAALKTLRNVTSSRRCLERELQEKGPLAAGMQLREMIVNTLAT